MPKVVVTEFSEAPSDQIVKGAARRKSVTDSLGRTLELKKLTPLDRMRMSKAAGADNATNQPYMLYALVAYSVVSIDGDELLMPVNERGLESTISRLGDEGYKAALEEVLKMYGDTTSEEVIEAAKK